jgi:transposase
VRNKIIWDGLLGLEDAVVEDVAVEDDQACGRLVARVRIKAGAAGRCGRCLRRAPGYDRGAGRRRWRHLDAGTMTVWIEGQAPRVSCRQCGVVTCHVPWARAGAGHTLDFDHQVAWLATHASKSAVASVMRIAWRTVGAIVTRVWADIDAV